MSDHELLQRYVRENSQPAFAALVANHVDLVYSAARRQVRTAHLAEEVAQSVFLELSRSAHRLADREPGRTASTTPLAAWLYVVTRRTAIDAVRRESRRLARETTAAEIAAMKTPPEAWSKVEASIDEAMATLNDTERSAIVLRFFQNLSLREVGESLGISEDTAQKRVSRALDRLRTFFVGRGVAVSGASLAADLSAHAIQTAPAGLGAAISAATALPHATAVATQIAMTTTQKALLAATLAVTLGAGVFEARIAVQQRVQLRDLQQRTDGLLADARNARIGYERSARNLDTAQSALTTRNPPVTENAGDESLTATMKAWLGRVDRLKQALAQHPELSIPELALLDDQIWFSIAQDGQVETDTQIRDLLARIRSVAENSIANRLRPALRAYVSAHDGQLPSQVSELAPLFNPPVDPAILQRYEMMQSGKASDVSPAERNDVIVEQSPVDPERDQIWRIGLGSFMSDDAASYGIRLAQKAFASAHDGARATTPEELLPYLKWPVSPAQISDQLRTKR